MTPTAGGSPTIAYPVVAISRDDRFFHASGSRRELRLHALVDAAEWTKQAHSPSTRALDLYDAGGRVLVATVGQGWLLGDVRATEDSLDPAALLARLGTVARYVATRAPDAVEVPVPRADEGLRPYLRRLVRALEAEEPDEDGADATARHQRGSLHNLLHALFG